MNVPVVSAIRFVVGHDLSLFPGSLKIVFLNEATQALLSQHRAGFDAVLRVGRANSQYIAEAVERDLVLDGVYKFAGDLVAGEGPANFARTDVGDHLLISVDKIWLLVSEVKGALESKPRCAALSVEGRNELLSPKGEFGKHYWEVGIVRPIEYAWRMREGQAICSSGAAAGN